ncbi:MAG: DUF58 domain-containing protein [Opitutae bacterium]
MNELDPEFTREILRKVRQIEIRSNRLVSEVFAGSYHSAFKGQGIDFEEVREYQPGDEVRTIDWNVTAKTGTPFVKQYREERELTILLAVDISKSTNYGSLTKSKREKLAELAALLAFSANQNGDKIGLLLFSDHVELYLPPTKGQKHVLRILREVLFRTSLGHSTNHSEAVRIINRVTRRRAVIFLLSDFIFPKKLADEPESSLTILLQQLSYTRLRHDIICGRIYDPKERELPNVGLLELEDSESGEILTIDTADNQARLLYQNSYARMEKEFSRELKKRGVDEFIFSTDGDFSKELYSFFRMRGKRRY